MKVARHQMLPPLWFHLCDALRKDKSEGQKSGEWLPRSGSRDRNCIQGNTKVFWGILEIFYILIFLVVI